MSRISGAALVALAMASAPQAMAGHCGAINYGCCAGVARCEEQSAYVTYRKECKTCWKLCPTTVTECVTRQGCREVEETCWKSVPVTCYRDQIETCWQTVKKICHKSVPCTEYQECRYTVSKPCWENVVREVRFLSNNEAIRAES